MAIIGWIVFGLVGVVIIGGVTMELMNHWVGD